MSKKGIIASPEKYSTYVLLNNILMQEVDYDDPITGKQGKQKIKYIMLMRLTRMALEGNLKAMDTVFNLMGEIRQTPSIEYSVTNNNFQLTDRDIEIYNEHIADLAKKYNKPTLETMKIVNSDAYTQLPESNDKDIS